jgi:hypothetical protein
MNDIIDRQRKGASTPVMTLSLWFTAYQSQNDHAFFA